MSDQIHIRYLESIGVTLDQHQRIDECLPRMRELSKQNDAWWRDKDVNYKAFRQMSEEALLIPIGSLKQGVEHIIGRSIRSDELHFSNESLRQEVISAWHGKK